MRCLPTYFDCVPSWLETEDADADVSAQVVSCSHVSAFVMTPIELLLSHNYHNSSSLVLVGHYLA